MVAPPLLRTGALHVKGATDQRNGQVPRRIAQAARFRSNVSS
jgi:hypothetical protein